MMETDVLAFSRLVRCSQHTVNKFIHHLFCWDRPAQGAILYGTSSGTIMVSLSSRIRWKKDKIWSVDLHHNAISCYISQLHFSNFNDDYKPEELSLLECYGMLTGTYSIGADIAKECTFLDCLTLQDEGSFKTLIIL
jgi:hypothetical protein